LDLIADGTSLATAGSAPEAGEPPEAALLDAAVLVAALDDDAEDDELLLLLPHPTTAAAHNSGTAAESQPLDVRIELLKSMTSPELARVRIGN
jgi:hypothetical protein